jgi:hypothetical protein
MRVFASASAAAGILTLASSLLVAADLASAKPTDQQLAAIKANCRSDFMPNCWRVPRRRAEAFQCLEDHLANLSASAQQAVKAVMATATPPSNSGTTQTASKPATETNPEATAAAPATSSPPAEADNSVPTDSGSSSAAASQSTVNAAPTATESAPSTAAKTTQSSSAGTGSSSGKAVAKKSSTTASTVASQTSEGAGAVAAKMKPTTQGAEPAASATTNAAAPPPALGFIPRRKKIIMACFCRDDFNAHCPGVDAGGGRAISCLEANRASRNVLTKLIC